MPIAAPTTARTRRATATLTILLLGRNITGARWSAIPVNATLTYGRGRDSARQAGRESRGGGLSRPVTPFSQLTGGERSDIVVGMTPQEMDDLVHLRRARDLIDRDYARPLDVPAMARAALMSPAHFSRKFRAAYGETPYSYLMTRRI